MVIFSSSVICPSTCVTRVFVGLVEPTHGQAVEAVEAGVVARAGCPREGTTAGTAIRHAVAATPATTSERRDRRREIFDGVIFDMSGGSLTGIRGGLDACGKSDHML
jgi:hypothetical protein